MILYKGRELHIEQLSDENQCKFMEFFSSMEVRTTKKNFHPFEFTEDSMLGVFSSIRKDLFFGAFERNRGMVGFGMLRGWDEGFDVPSLGLVVAEAMRGKGVGKRLVEYLIQTAKRNGSKRIRLSVYEDNDIAKNIYLRYGFRVEKIVESPIRNKLIMLLDVE